MSKIIIELTENSSTVITYDNDKIVYPICDINDNDFNISKITDNDILILISSVILQVGKSLSYQLIKQGFVNKTLNKPTDGK